MNKTPRCTPLIAIALACLLPACSPDADVPATDTVQASPAQARGAVPATDMPDGVVAPDHDPAMPAMALAGSRAVRQLARDPDEGAANAPDRGDLLAAPAKPVVRRAGPYTWHRADVSEAHALRAIVDGVLTLTAPSGRLLRFDYTDHEVHDDGNWTWIGRIAGGNGGDAILTFGPDAVFGTIAQADGAPLRVTMQDGASWVVETDVAARARQSEASGRYSTPDFLVPDELPIVEDLRARAAPLQGASASAAATTTVDVVVGYTFAYAWAMGGPSGVTTRLNHLVAVTNQSYENSQVAARVRMVHSMQVDYTDLNDNSDALTALSGSTGSTPDQNLIDPALKPLHDARNQYGADLVSLVRDFQHPEAVSCGVAWLIGGGQSTIHTGYQGFGMSVVSDGEDGGFFCDDSTFAHELGHNMGLAHDIETAKGDNGVLDPDEYGRFAYSFGYRTDAANGSFITVMAYSDDQQNSYYVFSNPDVSICGGFRCGQEGVADNAETLRQTIPIISQFRATVVPEPPLPTNYVVDDIDGDGDSDLTWRSNSETRFAYWLMDGASRVDALTFNVGSQWDVVAKGDLNADGVADIVWSNGSVLYLWAGDGNGTFSSSRIGAVPAGWRVFGAGDVNGDLKDDLLWRNDAQTRFAFWLMDGATRVASATFSAGPSWDLVVADDFGADGQVDLVWTNGSRLVMWTSTGTGFSAATIRSHPAGWTLVDSGDVDGDGKAELHWRSNSNESYAYWVMDGSTHVSSRTWRVSPAWTLAAVGDYNGDSFADLTWTSSTRVAQWIGNGTTFSGANVQNYPTGWSLLR